MKRFRSTLIVLLALLLCLSLVTGCAESANKAGNQEEPDKKTEEQPQQTVKNPDTIVYAFHEQPTTLDPHIAYDPASFIALCQIYESLVTYNEGSNEIVPQLAEKWEASNDGKEWTFFLKKGVKFSDGTPFNAEAVKFSFDRLLTINQGPAWMFEMITAIDVLDEHTVKFTLEYPFVPFMHALANPAGPLIVSPKAAKDNEKDGDLGQAWLKQNAVGTGPYMLERWNIGQDLVLVKNPDYWGGWEGKHVDRAVIKIVQESASQRMMLESGDVDFASAIPLDVIDRLELDTDITVLKNDTANLLNIFFNNQRGAMKDKKVRQAMSHGFSYDDCISGIFNNMGTRMRGPLPAPIWAFDETIKPYDKDIEKAKELLKEAGYPEGKGLKFTMMVETGAEDYKKVAELFQSDMKALGIGIDIQVVAWATIKDMLSSPETAPDIFISGFYPDYLDPDNVLCAMFHSDSIGQINQTFTTIKEVDDMLSEARRSTDSNRREELYKKVQQILNEEAVNIFILIRDDITTMRSWVKGFKFHPIVSPRFYYMYKE